MTKTPKPEDVERHRHFVQDAYHRADAMEHGDTYGDTPAALRRLADHADTLLARVAELERERDEARARAAAVLEEAATKLDVEWRKLNGLNCTHVCAIIRALATDADRDALAERDARIRREAYGDGWVNGSNGLVPPDFGDVTFDEREDE